MSREQQFELIKYIPEAVTAYQTRTTWHNPIDDHYDQSHADEVAAFCEDCNRFHKYLLLSRLEIIDGEFEVGVYRLLLSSGDAEEWFKIDSRCCNEPDDPEYLAWREQYSSEACERSNEAYVRSIAASGDDYIDYFSVDAYVEEEWLIRLHWTTFFNKPGKALFTSASTNGQAIFQTPEALPEHVRAFLCLEYDPEEKQSALPWKAYEGNYEKLINVYCLKFLHAIGPTLYFAANIRRDMDAAEKANYVRERITAVLGGAQPLLCQGCKHYVGTQFTNGTRLICGMHPYGMTDSCPDHSGLTTSDQS